MLYCICLLLIIFIVIYVLYMSNKNSNNNLEFLKSYGWVVEEKEIEKSEFKIPDEFDRVYENYNIIQKEADLDLEPYKGKEAVRYTYIVLNYPKATDMTVRANVILVDDKPVAGDIMTVELGGFMHSLKYPD